jgi:periplasmic divalent cation tolerance protein
MAVDKRDTILVLTNHPCELPEIISVPVAGGLPGYLDWMATQTAPE